MNIKNQPNFASGFASNPFDSKYPYLWNGLVGMWCPSLGRQGENVFDISLYRRHASLNNMDANTDYVPGVYGYALNYDGVNDFLDIGNIPEINSASQDLSISWWMRTLVASNNAMITYDDNNSLSPSTDFYIYKPSTISIGGIGTTAELDSGVPANDGNWHLLNIVLKGTTLKLYKDSILVYSVGVPRNHGDYSTGKLFRVSDNSNVSHFQGDVGDVFLHNRALAPNEVSDLYSGATPLIPRDIVTRAKLVGIEAKTVEENIVLTENITKQVSKTISESIKLTEDIGKSLAVSKIVNESIVLSEAIDKDFAKRISESIKLTETSNLNPSILKKLVEESIELTEVSEATIPQTSSFGTKIISFNPLIFVSDSDPAKITKVDITDPINPVHTVTTLAGAKNALDVAYNSTTGFIYVACADGIVVKIDASNFSSQTIINLNDSDNLETIEVLPNFALTYTGTENAIGELYMIDERETKLGDMRLDVLSVQSKFGDFDFNAIEALSMNSDFQALGTFEGAMNTDFKCLTSIINDLTPIKLTDFTVWVDSVQLSNVDVDLSSVQVTHTLDQKSQATFKLTRKHDRLDYDLDGNNRVITNQNTVVIKIQGQTEFTGKVSQLNCQYFDSDDSVVVTALGDEKASIYSNKTLSLPSLNSGLSLYDVLVQNPIIHNPFIDPDDTNPTKYKGIKIQLGQKIEQNYSRYTVVDGLGSIAEEIQTGTFVPKQNWTYFWSPTVTKFGNVELGETSAISFSYIGTSLAPVSEDLWNLDQADYKRQRQYEDKVEWLGDGVVSVSLFEDLNVDASDVMTDLQLEGYIDGSGNILNKFKQTSNVEDFNIQSAETKRNQIFDIVAGQLAYYVGEAPFQDVNARNGILITKYHWLDKNDGLYSVKDASYNFESYVQQVADLEYQKLLNINGQIFPETSATLNLTVDAYLYYSLTLLNRINIDNTTQSNIYNNDNGFPISIKSITIDASTRQVFLTANNSKSSDELEEIDNQFPDEEDEEFNEEAKNIFLKQKSDMRTNLQVE